MLGGFARSCCRRSLSAICEWQGDQRTGRAGGGGLGGLQEGEEREREGEKEEIQITRPQVWQYTDPGTGAGAAACREGRVGIWGVVEMGRRWGCEGWG